jgi:hypothetical protein
MLNWAWLSFGIGVVFGGGAVGVLCWTVPPISDDQWRRQPGGLRRQ